MQVGSLPTSNEVDVGAFAGSFGNVTNSYKFYWLLAILDGIREEDPRTISIEWLLCRMVALAWYPVHYFRLQFGKADMLGEVVTMVMNECGLPRDASIADVTAECLKLPKTSNARRELEARKRFVPFRFIRPFFETETRGLKDHQVNNRIDHLASETFRSDRPPMYRFVGGNIELAEAWSVYMLEHLAVLRGFCNWNLVLYLQSRNPNVGNISGKLSPPLARELSAAKKFWQIAFAHGVTAKCLYSDREIPALGFSLDHFLPWSFVAHDALWNICPTIAEVNSSKGDRLPALDIYLSAFAALQFDAVQTVIEFGPAPLLEDYTLLFRTASTKELAAVRRDEFVADLQNIIRPQVQIAANCGFASAWQYRV